MAITKELELDTTPQLTLFCLPLAVLMKCFNGFCKEGVVRAETVEEILQMMGLRVAKKALQDIIQEVDEDGEWAISDLEGENAVELD